MHREASESSDINRENGGGRKMLIYINMTFGERSEKRFKSNKTIVLMMIELIEMKTIL